MENAAHKFSRKELKFKLLEIVSELEEDDWSLERVQSLPLTMEVNLRSKNLQVELILLEKDTEKCHIGISIDDGRFWNTIFPISSSFFVRPERGVVPPE